MVRKQLKPVVSSVILNFRDLWGVLTWHQGWLGGSA